MERRSDTLLFAQKISVNAPIFFRETAKENRFHILQRLRDTSYSGERDQCGGFGGKLIDACADAGESNTGSAASIGQ
jgi:hypothetical protein